MIWVVVNCLRASKMGQKSDARTATFARRTCMLFETYSRQTIKVITKIDDDTKIVVMMTTMTAWKFNKFGIAEWKVIFSAEGYEASWPELRKLRK